MLTKLAFKNVGRSLRDYAVYFFTLVLGVSIFYMFNSIYAQQELMVTTESLNASMIALRQILSAISVFVAIVLGFLIVYANYFFIKRRKKELGIYMTLGMSKRKISLILVLETSLMAIIALLVGLFLGVFASQFMSVFTARIFEADMTAYKFIFAPAAAFKSLLYFGIIFLIVILFNTIAIGKVRLIELIYGGRKNETLKLKHMGLSIAIFVLSIACLGAAYALILTNGMVNINPRFWSSILLGSIGTLLFFCSLSGILTKLVQANKALYLKNLNMFVTRQLNAKINTNFISVSVVCIVLLLTIGIFSCGYSVQNVLSNELKQEVPYDVSFYEYGESEENVVPLSIMQRLPDDLIDSPYVKQFAELHVYTLMDCHLSDFASQNDGISSINDYSLGWPIDFISLSDYNTAMTMSGTDTVNLSENEYLVIYNHKMLKEQSDLIASRNTPLIIDENELHSSGTAMLSGISNSQYGMYFVVSDEYVSYMNESQVIANVNCTDENARNEYVKQIDDYCNNTTSDQSAFTHYTDKTSIYEASITGKALISFLAIYLGIVFMIACAAILAIQQLSEAADNKERYELLKKLGADSKMLNRALFTQIAYYFTFPLALAAVHSAVGLTAANEVIQEFGQINIPQSIAATALFIAVVYGFYFFLTYIGSKNIINKG